MNKLFLCLSAKMSRNATPRNRLQPHKFYGFLFHSFRRLILSLFLRVSKHKPNKLIIHAESMKNPLQQRYGVINL